MIIIYFECVIFFKRREELGYIKNTIVVLSILYIIKCNIGIYD
jgi:hypothetical protein